MNEQLHAMRVAVAELGHDPNVYQEPTARDLERTPDARVIAAAGLIPQNVSWKAMALYRLRSDGAEAAVHCVQTCETMLWNSCPLHPVGALLAGTDRGCGRR